MASAILDINILIYALLMGMFILFAKTIATRSSFFGPLIDQKLNNLQFESHLEGLRGILAFNVFFHHAAYTWQTLVNGRWSKPTSHFMDLIGGASVSMFFFLSGYLFWRMFLNHNSKTFSIWKFYSYRFFRIAPLYWSFCALLLVIVFVQAEYSLKVSLAEFLIQSLQWLAVGMPFGVFPDINGHEKTRMINIDVAWSLRHEVMFYILLPFLLLFAKGKRTLILMGLIAAMYLAFYVSYKFMIMNVNSNSFDKSAEETLIRLFRQGVLEFMKFLLIGFAPGMLCAYIYQQKERGYISMRYLSGYSGVLILAICLYFLLFNTDPDLSFLRLIPLWVIFLTITCSNFANIILRSKGLILLGFISFGVYLFHGIILYFLLKPEFNFYFRADFSYIVFWVIIGLSGLLLIVICAILFRFIEYPCINLKKKFR